MSTLKPPDCSYIPLEEDFGVICRICLEKGKPLHSIFAYKDSFGNNVNKDLSLLIKLSSNVDIDYDDLLPENICERCVNLLLISHYFKTLCENSDAKLRAIIYKNNKTDKSDEKNLVLKEEYDSTSTICSKTFPKINNGGDMMKIADCITTSLHLNNNPFSDSYLDDDDINSETESNNFNSQNMHDTLNVNLDIKDTTLKPNSGFLNQGIFTGTNYSQQNSVKDQTSNVKRKDKKHKNSDHKLYELTDEYCEMKREKKIGDANAGEIVKIQNRKIMPLSDADKQKLKNLKESKNKFIEFFAKKDSALKKLPTNKASPGCYECLKCSVRFPDKAHLNMHMVKMHFNKKNYKCYGCELTFNKISERVLHEAKCPNIKPGTEYICRICNTSFSKRREYDIHLVTHNGPESDTLVIDQILQCSQCDFTTTRRSSLNSHFNNKHNPHNDYVCETCGKHYTNKNTFISHKATHRPVVKKYKCAECGYATKFNNCLRNHQRKHTREYAFTCEQCGKCFITNGALQIHRKRHTGIRPFQCDQCDKNYLKKSELVGHIASIHQKLRPHKCPLCDSAFFQRSKCYKHLRQVHKMVTPVSHYNTPSCNSK